MSELTFLVLQLGFLLLLWGFVFFVVYSLRSDLFGQRARRLPAAPAAASAPAETVPAPSAAPAPKAAPEPALTEPVRRAEPAADEQTPRRLVITSGPREGLEVDLPGEQLTIGRSSESGLVIRDDYTSTHHARLMPVGTTTGSSKTSTRRTARSSTACGSPCRPRFPPALRSRSARRRSSCGGSGWRTPR